MSRPRALGNALLVGALLAAVGAPMPVVAVDSYEVQPSATPSPEASLAGESEAASSAPGSPAPASPSAAPAAGPIALERVEDAAFDLTTDVPQGWRKIGPGTRSRATSLDDLTVLAVQSAPVSEEDLWAVLLPQLFVTEIPPVTDERRTAAFDWEIHDFETQVADMPLAVAVALAEVDATTYLVLLQATPEEMAVLRDAVFLAAVDGLAVITPTPTPDPATLGYQVEEVRFPGGDVGVELAGTLTLPEGDGPHPVIVLLSGSGPQDRNESARPAALIEPFALLADALTPAGIGVLRYDDRGVGGSTGDYGAATVADLTGDGRAALDYLMTRSDVDRARVGLLGHSEGALYAATLGAEDPRVAYIVVLAPPAIDGARLLAEQNEAVARAWEFSDAEVAASAEFGERICPAVLAGGPDAIESFLRDATEGYWERQSDDVRKALGDQDVFVDRQVAAQLPALRSEWFRSFCASDPAADWGRVTVPVLALFGGNDVQVLAESNAAGLRDALAEAGHDDVTIVTIDDANHLFQASETGALQEYATLADTFGPEVLPTIVGWLVKRAGVVAEDPSPAP